MEILTDLLGKKKKLFTSDAQPNPAFRNTFQTNEFRCVLKRIKLYDTCEELCLEEGECIASFELSLMNMSNDDVEIYCEDFMLQSDKKAVVYPLLLQNDTLLDKVSIAPNDVFDGLISFIAPTNAKFLTLKYQEYIEDWEGKIYKLKYAIP